MRIRVMIADEAAYEPTLRVDAELGLGFRAMPRAEQHRMIDRALEQARETALRIIERDACEAIPA